MASFPVGALDNPLNLAVLLVLAVLLFGKQLPEVMRTFGNGIRELRKAANFEDMADAVKAVNEIRGVATTTAIVRAAVPGAAEIQDSIAETQGIVAEPLDGSAPVVAESAPIAAQPAPVAPEPAPLVKEPEAAETPRATLMEPGEGAPKPHPQAAPPLPTPRGVRGTPVLPYPADPWVERPVRPALTETETETETENADENL